MKSAAAILAGLLTGIIVAAGVLAALVFVGPDSAGLRPSPSPSSPVLASPSTGPSAIPSTGPTASGSPRASPAPDSSGSAAPGSGGSAFRAGESAPALPILFFVDTEGIVRDGVSGRAGADAIASD